jgi:hypothetical protein
MLKTNQGYSNEMLANKLLTDQHFAQFGKLFEGNPLPNSVYDPRR